MEQTPLQFELNGISITIEVDLERNALDVLRSDLGLTGTKKGCDEEGLCGGCTIIIDGKARRACRTPIASLSGKRVYTIEGVALSDALHPIQQAFIDYGAVQCGYCTPGMILSAKALLDRNPDPSREEIIHAIQGNLCRCTGYAKIITAISAAADRMRDSVGSEIPAPQHSLTLPLGGDLRRQDSLEKVTGKSEIRRRHQASGRADLESRPKPACSGTHRPHRPRPRLANCRGPRRTHRPGHPGS